MRRTAGVIVLFVALGARAQDAPPRRALLIGSSSVAGAVGRTLERELGAMGITLERRAHTSSGFARPDFFDWEWEASRLAPFDEHEVVLIYAGGNDVQALRLRDDERQREGVDWVYWRDEVRWVAIYTERVRVVIDAICDDGARRVVLVPPVDGGREGWRDRIRRVIAAQRAGAAASRCGVAVDANDGTPFRSVDGVHLSERGAERMWSRIEPELRALLLHPTSRAERSGW